MIKTNLVGPLDYVFYRFYCFAKIISLNIYVENVAVFILIVPLFLNVYKALRIIFESIRTVESAKIVIAFIVVYLPVQLYYGSKKRARNIVQRYSSESNRSKIISNILIVVYLLLSAVFAIC